MSRSWPVGPRYNWASKTIIFEPGIMRGLARIAIPVTSAEPAAEGFGWEAEVDIDVLTIQRKVWSWLGRVQVMECMVLYTESVWCSAYLQKQQQLEFSFFQPQCRSLRRQCWSLKEESLINSLIGADQWLLWALMVQFRRSVTRFFLT